MPEKNAHTPSKENPIANFWRSRAYLFLVTSLGVFLLGLVVIRVVPGLRSTPPDEPGALADAGPEENETYFATLYETARAAVEAARTRAQQAHQSLDAFVYRRAEETSATMREVTSAKVAANAVANLPEVPTRVPNPAHRDLSLQWREAQAKRKLLATRLTNEHPDLQNMDQQVAAIAAQISATPEFITQGEESSRIRSQVATQQLAAIQKAEEILRTKQQHWDAEENRLTQAVNEAEQDVDRCSHEERTAWQNAQAANNRRLAAEQAVKIAALRKTGEEQTTLGIVAILAVVVGSIVSWAGNERNHVFQTVEQAQANLPVPVLGVMTDSRRIDPPQSTAVPKFVPLVRGVAEVTLLIAVVAFGAALIADQKVASQFKSDPLGTFNHTVERVFLRHRG